MAAETKRCRVCGENRPMSDFWADKRARDGKQNSCRVCNKAASDAWKKANPEKHLAYRRRRSERAKAEWRNWAYGITHEEYDALLKMQGGVCALCGRPPKTRSLAVDHDHSTGVVRGLLCLPCNTALGKLGDSIETLERAIDYLRGATMASGDITKVSKSPATDILKQGHTTNGKFGSDPNAQVKGGKAVRNLDPPSTGRR